VLVGCFFHSCCCWLAVPRQLRAGPSSAVAATHLTTPHLLLCSDDAPKTVVSPGRAAAQRVADRARRHRQQPQQGRVGQPDGGGGGGAFEEAQRHRVSALVGASFGMGWGRGAVRWGAGGRSCMARWLLSSPRVVCASLAFSRASARPGRTCCRLVVIPSPTRSQAQGQVCPGSRRGRRRAAPPRAQVPPPLWAVGQPGLLRVPPLLADEPAAHGRGAAADRLADRVMGRGLIMGQLSRRGGCVYLRPPSDPSALLCYLDLVL